LVEVLDRLIVVGLAGQQMTALAQIDDPLEVARIKAKHDGAPHAPATEGIIAKYLSLISSPSSKKTGGSKQ